MAAAGFFQVPLALLKALRLPRFHHPAGDGERAIRQGQLVINFHHPAKSAAEGAGTDRMVKGKEGRGGLVELPLVPGAVVSAGVEMEILGFFGPGHGSGALAEAQAGGQGLRKAGTAIGRQGNPVLDHRQEQFFLRTVAEGMGQLGQSLGFVEAHGHPVQQNAPEPLPGDEGGRFIRRSFFGERNAEEKPELLPGELFPEILQNGVGSPRADGFAAVGAGELGEAGEEEFEVVGDFRDGANGAAGGADRIGLTEGDGRRNAVDPVDAGPVHSFQKLAGVGAKGFGVAALAFGVEGVKGEGGFSRSGRSGEDMEHSQGKIEGEITQIVLAGAFDADGS